MKPLSYKWRASDSEHELRLVPVTGTGGRPYLFGRAAQRRQHLAIAFGKKNFTSSVLILMS
jgi:hypothetical protein